MVHFAAIAAAQTCINKLMRSMRRDEMTINYLGRHNNMISSYILHYFSEAIEQCDKRIGGTHNTENILYEEEDTTNETSPAAVTASRSASRPVGDGAFAVELLNKLTH
jgi:hypothetical protein